MAEIDCATCSEDPASVEMLALAQANGIENPWQRKADQGTQCKFGADGICCRVCMQGPCRINPRGDKPRYGVCGADRHTIVARNLTRMIAAGTASHSDHGRHIALAMLHMAEGKLPDYSIRDEAKLRAVADKLGVATEGRSVAETARDVALLTLTDFQRQDPDEPCTWLTATLPAPRLKKLGGLGLLPHNIDATVALAMARTHVGCDADPVNLVKGSLRTALADYDGMALATDLSDALFGTPRPVVTAANLGVLKKDAVNIAVNGHNPLLSDVVCDVAREMQAEAVAAGAPAGINVIGICCTGNEVMVRHGIPLAANQLSQELPILTGVLEAMVLDTQCIMPSLPRVAECFHTRVITTMEHNRISGATHVPFSEKTAAQTARAIVGMAIEAFGRRQDDKIHIPATSQTAIAGFSTEAIVAALSLLDADDPLKPVVDAVASGAIQGVVLFAGCNNPKTRQDRSYFEIAKALAAKNVLILATGCGAGALAKLGLMTQEAVAAYAGDGLKAVLTAVGEAAGLNGPLPLVLHMGSCVDNTRAVSLATALANRLGVDLSDLPVVASAPEWMAEKAASIGTWSVALGLPTHLGVVPPVIGSDVVTGLLTETAKDLVGGYFIVEPDPALAAERLYEAISERRRALGLP